MIKGRSIICYFISWQWLKLKVKVYIILLNNIIRGFMQLSFYYFILPVFMWPLFIGHLSIHAVLSVVFGCMHVKTGYTWRERGTRMKSAGSSFSLARFFWLALSCWTRGEHGTLARLERRKKTLKRATKVDETEREVQRRGPFVTEKRGRRPVWRSGRRDRR